MDKLSINDLAMCYNQLFVGKSDRYTTEDAEDEIIGYLFEVRVNGVTIMSRNEEGQLYDFYINEVKPVRRPLTDMSEEEMKHAYSSGHPDDLKYVITRNTWSPEQFKYLMSKGFDLFNWIEKGLAIDRTTLNTKEG